MIRIRHAVEDLMAQAEAEHDPAAELTELEAHLQVNLNRVRRRLDELHEQESMEFVDQFSV